MKTKFLTFLRKHKILFKFVISYIMILLIPLGIGFYVYILGVQIVSEDTRTINLAMLKQTQASIEKELREIENLAIQISLDSHMGNYISYSNQSSDTAYDLYPFIQSLKHKMINRTFPDGCYVFFKNSNYIATQDTLYSADLFYSNILKYKPERFDDWKSFLTSNHFKGEVINMDPFLSNTDQDENSYLTYAISLPFDITREPQATVIIYIKKSKLAALLPHVYPENTSYTFIQDSNHNVLVTSTVSPPEIKDFIISNSKDNISFATKKFNNQDMIFISDQSNYNNWIYTYAQPKNIAFEKLYKFKKIYLTILFASMSICMAIVIFIAYRNSKPIYRILNNLRSHLDEGNIDRYDAYIIIDQSIRKLITSYEDLQSDIQKQRPSVITAFFNTLLYGLIYSESEALHQAKHLNLEIKGNMFVVLLFRIENNALDIYNLNTEEVLKLNHFKTKLKEQMELSFDDLLFVYDVDYRTTAFTLNGCWNHKDEYMNHIKERLHKFTENHQLDPKIKYFIAVGEIYNQINEISYSFHQAKRCLNAFSDESQMIHFHHAMQQYSERNYYPIEMEQHLAHLTQTGEYADIHEILDTIYTENYHRRILSPKANKELIYQLKATISRLVPSYDIDEIDHILTKISSKEQPEQNFHLLKQAYQYICSLSNQQKRIQNINMANEIRDYVQANYMLADLSLATIASHFNFSEGYFSSLFKEHIGITFVDYVEQVRMEKARTLLTDTRLTINEIALLVGYNSAQSFRRAFKRVYEINPTVLRN